MIFNFSFKDFLDILIITIFLYLILSFILRKRYTLFVLFGIFFWYLIFFISTQFNLFLTNFIFKWFISFGLLFIILFILAQEIKDFLYFLDLLDLIFLNI
jgi:DNA integrity scanning protein DisA with diadenylate cyclase activity